VIREQQAALAKRWRAAAAALAAAVDAGSYDAMTKASRALESALRRWEAVAAVQAVSWVSAVTPQQMARLCVRAFPYAPTGDALLEHLLLVADAAAAEARAAQQVAAAEAERGGG
jgi:hypothetical protein